MTGGERRRSSPVAARFLASLDLSLPMNEAIMKTLHPTKMRHAADYVRTQHHVVVDPDVTADDVQVPAFWAHHVDKVRVHALIDIIRETYDLTLRVTGKGVGYVETRLLRKWESSAAMHKLSAEEMAEIEALIPDGYTVDHTPRTLWRVRLTDGGIEIARSLKSKPEAVQAAIAHSKRASGIAA